MAFPTAFVEERTKRSEELLAEMKSRGVEFAQIEMTDPNGLVRGKYGPIKKALSPIGSGISSLIVAPRSLDELVDAPFTNLDNGYPKIVSLPDYNTLRQLSWRPDMASILTDLYMEDGSPCMLDPRHILKGAIAKLAEKDLEAKAAIEFELYVFHRDEELLKSGRFNELRAFGDCRDFYSITRTPEFEDLSIEFMKRMASIGIEIEAFHTEYGVGMIEFIMGVAPVLEAADNATRAKLYFRQFCAERGLIATYMPKMGLIEADNASGAHHNVSLWSKGKNTFWDDRNQSCSELASQFAAGVLETAKPLHAVFKPWVNSYRRMDRYAFSPENASWGLDNHSVSLRLVHGVSPEKQTRFEHRLAAVDINFHLTYAAILLGGLYGIDNALTPPPLAEGDASESDVYTPLSKTLAEATDDLQSSELAKQLLGEEFVEHFSIVRKDEWRDFAEWCASKNIDPTGNDITDWERDHYFIWA